MVKFATLCVDCVQIITNPICPECYSKQVLEWLRDKDISLYNLNKIIDSFKRLLVLNEETPSNIKCIICGSKKVNICIYCFTNRAQKIIERNTNEKTGEDFKEDFNTQIWRI